MNSLEEKIALLPPTARQEAYDFVEFLLERYTDGQKNEKAYWRSVAEAGLSAIWANEEDDVYDELCKR